MKSQKKRLKLADMPHFGAEVALTLQPGSIVALTGDLGSGKTTLSKQIIHALTHIPTIEITSPTFTYLQLYDGHVAHFDLYRLKHPEEFAMLGFEEYLAPPYTTLIEWPEVVTPLLDGSALRIHLEHVSESEREVTISP